MLLRRWFSLPPVWLLVLLLLTVANFGKLVGLRNSSFAGIDFQPLYVGQQLLSHGQNPYDDAALKHQWEQARQQAHLPRVMAPGLPNTPLLYPPWGLVVVRATVGSFTYPLARTVWWAFCGLGLLLSCWLWPRIIAQWGGPRLTPGDLLLGALAIKCTTQALLNGQFTFVALGLGTAAIWAGLRGWSGLAGVLLALAAGKPTMALPFIFYFAWQRQWKALGAGAATGLLLLMVALRMSPDVVAQLHSYTDLLAQMQASIFDHSALDYPLNYWPRSFTELSSVLDFVHPGVYYSLAPFKCVLVGAIGCIVAGQGRALSWLQWWLVAVTTLLLTTYHFLYDTVLLLPLLAWLPTQSRRRQIAAGLAVAPLFLPVNFVLAHLGLPPSWHWLYFSLPLGLLALLPVLLMPVAFQPLLYFRMLAPWGRQTSTTPRYATIQLAYPSPVPPLLVRQVGWRTMAVATDAASGVRAA